MILKVLLVLVLSLAFQSESASTGGKEWNYEKEGPDAWPYIEHNCDGKRQSPINIKNNEVEYDGNLANFELINYDKPRSWNVTNNGHTVQVSSNDPENKIGLSGSDFKNEYDFLQFHFHWGFNNYQGSEHYIDGKKFPLEMHLVHMSKRQEATVLGFLFEISKENNTALDVLLSAVALARNKEDPAQTTNFSLESIILPASKLNKYYRYQGSLTTPPCNEIVTWNVLADTIKISNEQMRVFRVNNVKANFREPQKLFERKVFASFEIPQGSSHAESSNTKGSHGAGADSSCKNAGSKLPSNNIFVLFITALLYKLF